MMFTSIFKPDAWAKALAVGAVCTLMSFPTAVKAQSNVESIGVLAGYPGSTTAKLGEELAISLNGWSGIQVRTLIGRGSQQNVDDLLYLRGVDLAFLNSDVMTNLRVTQPDHPALDHLSYIAKVTESELHLVVRNDSTINDIFDLQGKRVAIGNSTSGTALTARLMLRLLGIRATGIFMDPHFSLEALKNEELDGVFILGAKPLPILQNLREEDGLRLAAIEFPFSDGESDVYNAAEFVPTDYPSLVKEKLIPAISVPVVLAAYDKFAPSSSRFKNIESFTRAFLDTIPRLQQPPRHPKWRQIDLAAEISGWERMDIVEQTLRNQ